MALTLQNSSNLEQLALKGLMFHSTYKAMIGVSDPTQFNSTGQVSDHNAQHVAVTELAS